MSDKRCIIVRRGETPGSYEVLTRWDHTHKWSSVGGDLFRTMIAYEPVFFSDKKAEEYIHEGEKKQDNFITASNVQIMEIVCEFRVIKDENTLFPEVMAEIREKNKHKASGLSKLTSEEKEALGIEG